MGTGCLTLALTTHILFAGSRDDDTQSMPDVRSRESAEFGPILIGR